MGEDVKYQKHKADELYKLSDERAFHITRFVEFDEYKIVDKEERGIILDKAEARKLRDTLLDVFVKECPKCGGLIFPDNIQKLKSEEGGE